MQYNSETKPGVGDPYWYEWSVGLQYIIDMLNPDSGIKYVELQANVSLGLDDVVVTYVDGKKLFIQVKHTRTDDTLTFGDLVSKDKESGRSLLQILALGWSIEKNKYSQTNVLLFTNRAAGKRVSRKKNVSSFQRPALEQFLPQLKEKVGSAQVFEEIQFSDYKEAWSEWVSQLECIGNDSDKLSFLKCLQIDTNNSGLHMLQETLLQKIQIVFQTNETIADDILSKLDHALRTWSTSIRDKTIIDKEEVYSKLSLSQEHLSYNQDLIPCDPFFSSRENLVKSLENELCFMHHKIIFLSGIPGCGKTNIISKLSAKRESPIDIRYYAYEPINPEKDYFTGDVSRRVDKDYFWNELFNQLRRLLNGQLYKYHVPVINDLMTLEDKRKRFFDIASKYATDRGRIFVVAIDGIDHAARAINIENTFLPTLPNPEYIPSNVKLLLAGQPKADYHNYPDWLFSDNTNVIEVNMPSILFEDIKLLVDIRFSEKSEDYRTQLSELISKYAEGNTLAAIFAVHEALLEPTLFKLEKNLKNRSLSGNIHNYYKAIWNNAIRRIQPLFLDYKVAGIFAFFNEPVNEKKLYSIFSDEHLSLSTWRNVLKELSPLLSEESGNYTFLHNDVRVFLSSIIGQDQDHVKEVYSYLTDYYLTLPEKNEGYYRDIFRFMKASDRLNEFEQIFSPEFIISSYVYGIELEEISEMALSILKWIKDKKPINWGQMRSLAFGYMTINQIEKSEYEIDSFSFRENHNAIPIHPYECYVDSFSSWNNALLSNVLSLTEKMYKAGLNDRANKLFKRWFSGLNISDIIKIVELHEDKDFLSPSIQELARQLGLGICNSDEYNLLKGARDISENNNAFMHHLINSVLETIIMKYSSNELESALKQLDVIYYDSLLKNLLSMLSDNRLADIYHMSMALDGCIDKTPIGVLLTTFMKIVSFKIKFSQEQKDELWKLIEPIDFNVFSFENEISYFSIYAFVATFLQSKTRSIIAHEIVKTYIGTNLYRDPAYYGMYFNNVCLIGEWFSNYQKGESIIIRANDLYSLMQALYLTRWKHNVDDYEINKFRTHLLRAYIFFSKTADKQICTVINRICQQAFADNPVNSLLDAGFYFYINDSGRQKLWYEDWLGCAGRVWQEPIGDRNDIIQRFMRVVHLYDINKCIDITEALEKARWSIIGYASHKEYICAYLLNWYNSLVEKQGRIDPFFAKKIKEVSDQTEKLGDNRSEYRINSKIYGDLFSCGFQTIKETLQNNHYLCQGFESPSYFVDGLIGYLKDGFFDQDSLLKIWAIGMAVLDWKDDSNHDAIYSLQRAIELCAKRSGVSNIHALLQKSGYAYIDLVPDPVRFVIPERWCDKSGELDNVVSDEIIKSYLEGDKIPKDTIAKSIDLLSLQGKISKEIQISLFVSELEKEEWGIDRNPIISHLMRFLSFTETDSLITQYLDRIIVKKPGYIMNDLPALVLWQIGQQDDSYAQDGLWELVKMHKVWMTSVNHFQEPDIRDNYDYTQLIDWDHVTDIYSLFYQIIKVLILSEDADAARTALSGLFVLEKIDEFFIEQIEKDWPIFHFRAKEWLLMIYELLWDVEEKKQNIIQRCIKTHCNDEDLNVALYANLLMENIDNNFIYIKSRQSYFDSIPSFGARKLIRITKSGPWITGGNFVTKSLCNLEKLIGEDCSDIEERTVLYADFIDKELSTIPLKRYRNGGYQVTLDKIILSFLRVLYKDWISGRWEGLEAQIARIILSASEPYALLISPHLWDKNGHKLIDDLENFDKQSIEAKNKQIQEIIETGISDNEAVIAGNIREYTHNKEIFGFYLTYIGIPGMPSSYAAHRYESNSRYFLQRRDDFIEDEHFNISLHHNGVESFKDSNVSCSLSKRALTYFGWSIHLSADGFLLADVNGSEIGRLEYYYAYRTTINRYPCNQPYLQRWIIKREQLIKQKRWPISTVVENVTNSFE